MTRSHLVGLCTLLAVSVGLSLAAGACGVDALDLNGHPCPCGAGFACDTARNLCVPPGDIPVDASVVEQCVGENCACVTADDCHDRAYPKCIDAKCVACTS